ncbi:MAG TPA: radical SAM protein [Atribacteraceae bacterium]|nr:radical SAM protein [Atribacteraceae bacterium]
MNILLVSPKTVLIPKKKARFVPFPQASLPLIAALTPPEHKVQIVDERLEEINFSGKYDLVGITVMTGTAPRAYFVADEFRRRGTKVVMGGIHPSALPEEALLHADSVVVGEAEGLWKRVLEDAQSGTLQPTYRSENFPCLENMPSPRHELLKDRYLLKHVFQTTRGCPHQCGFCSVSTFNGRKYRHRPLEDVIREVASCSKRFIGFLDDNIVGNPRYSKELFRALVPLRKKWVSQGTVKMAEDDELIRLAQKSGCISLFVGFESINEVNLKNMRKMFNSVERYKKLVENFHRHGIMVVGSFVFGFDDDDESVFSSTLRFIEEAKIDFASFNILTPLPGTEIFDTFKKDGRIFNYDWSQYDFSHVVYHPAKMTVERLQAGHRYLYSRFYSLSSITRRIPRNLKHLSYFLPASLYYNWVSRQHKTVPERQIACQYSVPSEKPSSS